MSGIGKALGIAAVASLVAAGGAYAAGAKLSSKDIKPGAMIANAQVFNGFGCSGDNISPDLAWSGVPASAKSLALTVYDPDAPTGSGFWHWVVINIPPDTKGLPEKAGDPKSGLMPAAALQTRTDFGVPGYGGPCPPKGDKAHRYQYKLYAVDVPSLEGVTADTSAAVVGFMLHFHGKLIATMTGHYGR